MAITNSVNAKNQGYQVLNTSTGVWSGRTFQAGTGITLTNADGTAGNTTISASTTGSFSVVEQVFTSSGTYTPTTGMAYCIIEVLGGGGAGGGAITTNSSTFSVGGGGGGGQYNKNLFTAATIGASKSVTIGAAGSGNSGAGGGNGGTTSVGSLISGGGGTGGATNSSSTNDQIVGSLGGTGGTGGLFASPGNAGGFSLAGPASAGFFIGAQGANSMYGAGGNAISSSNSNGVDALGYGAGGGGGINGTSNSATSGGNGTAGLVVITEFVASTIAPTSITTVTFAQSPYTVIDTDYYLSVQSSGGAITLRLPNAPATGRVYTIKDASGAASTNNISITTVGGTVLIDGVTTTTILGNYGSISVIFDGTAYSIW